MIAPDQRPGAGARGHRRILEARVHVGECRRKEKIGGRHQRQPLHEHHAGQGVDVERRLAERESAGQELIEHAVARAEQHRPGDREQNRRRRHRQQDEAAQRLASRQVRTLDQPREAEAERQRDRGRAEREQQRRPQQGRKARVAIGRRVVAKCEAGIERKPAGTKAAQDDQRQRHQHEIAEHKSHAERGHEAQPFGWPAFAPRRCIRHSAAARNRGLTGSHDSRSSC